MVKKSTCALTLNFGNKFSPKSKRSQMKIQQTAFMLIAVTLFFVLAGIFVLSFRLSDLKKQAASLQEENALLLASKIANSPEFSCGNAFGTTRTNCIDLDKVMALKDKKEYENFWKGSNIEIRKLYPPSQEECSMINYPDCGIIKIAVKTNTGTSVGNFASLCRKELVDGESIDKCEIGKILVSYGGSNE
jgi:hypothetical protein